MNTNNIVSSILKGYAWFNALAGLIISLVMLDSYVEGITVLFIFCIIVASSFVIDAFGEVIQLLHEIKENTAKSATSSRNLIDDIEANLPEM